jgi:DNA polymerase delta subunit 1
LPIAETTIVAGAKYLVQAKELVQERYSDVVNVVYGDTDSVFVKTVEDLSVADAIKYLFEMDLVNDRLGEKISKEVSDEFPDPVFLEFEKVMFPSMLMNRKVYLQSSIF